MSQEEDGEVSGAQPCPAVEAPKRVPAGFRVNAPITWVQDGRPQFGHVLSQFDKYLFIEQYVDGDWPETLLSLDIGVIQNLRVTGLGRLAVWTWVLTQHLETSAARARFIEAYKDDQELMKRVAGTGNVDAYTRIATFVQLTDEEWIKGFAESERSFESLLDNLAQTDKVGKPREYEWCIRAVQMTDPDLSRSTAVLAKALEKVSSGRHWVTSELHPAMGATHVVNSAGPLVDLLLVLEKEYGNRDAPRLANIISHGLVRINDVDAFRRIEAESKKDQTKEWARRMIATHTAPAASPSP